MTTVWPAWLLSSLFPDFSVSELSEGRNCSCVHLVTHSLNTHPLAEPLPCGKPAAGYRGACCIHQGLVGAAELLVQWFSTLFISWTNDKNSATHPKTRYSFGPSNK